MRAVAIVALLAASVFAASLHAQVVTDPYDSLYDDLEVWEAKGLVGSLPLVQPYPLQMVRHLLTEVIDNPQSSGNDQSHARYLLARMEFPLHISLDVEARSATPTAGPYVLTALDPDLQGMATPWLGGSARVRLMFVAADDGLGLPAFRENPEDFVFDRSDFDFAGQNLQVRQVSYGSFGIGEGDGSLLFQVGLGRHRVGPFWENGVVVGQQAPQAGLFSLLMQQEYFSAHLSLYELTATNDQGIAPRTGKHLFYHGIEFHPLPWLDIGAFETVVSGDRLELLYFIPITAYFHSQGINGFSDNSLVGLDTRVTPLTGLDLKGLLYVDDISFNDLVRGVFDSKYKLAAQLGASMAPSALFPSVSDVVEPVRLVTVDYTAVMPYMFTHIRQPESPTEGDRNYEAYTHGGVNFGPALQPNSDRVEVRALVRPFADVRASLLDIEARMAFVRHGNASAGIIPDDGTVPTPNGSILDPGYLNADTPTFQEPFIDPTGQPHTRFLTQAVLEETFQLGATASWTFDAGSFVSNVDNGWDPAWGRFSASMGYTFQRRQNADLVVGSVVFEHFGELGLTWRY